MKMNEIIAQAREKGIMPILKPGVHLELKRKGVFMVDTSGSKRKLFDIFNKHIILSKFVETAKNSKMFQDSSSYWEPFIKMGPTIIEDRKMVRYGDTLQEFLWKTSYTNSEGEEVLFEETRTRIIPNYKEDNVKCIFMRILFEKKEDK